VKVSQNEITECGAGIIVDYWSEYVFIQYNSIMNSNETMWIGENGGGCQYINVSKNNFINNSQGICLIYADYSVIEQNNFINIGFPNSFLLFCKQVKWISNYWSSWKWRIPKPIIDIKWPFFPMLAFDWYPAVEPYEW